MRPQALHGLAVGLVVRFWWVFVGWLAHAQCAKRRHRSSVDKTETSLFVREHNEKFVSGGVHEHKTAKTPHKKRRNTGIFFFHFCSRPGLLFLKLLLMRRL